MKQLKRFNLPNGSGALFAHRHVFAILFTIKSIGAVHRVDPLKGELQFLFERGGSNFKTHKTFGA